MKERDESERDFEKRLIEAARRFGWKCWHFHDSRREVKPGVFVGDKDAAGLCDWILLHDDPPRLVFLELKREGGKLSDKQQEFLQAAKLVADAEEEEWMPGHEHLIGVFAAWPDDEERIIQMLRTKVVT